MNINQISNTSTYWQQYYDNLVETSQKNSSSIDFASLIGASLNTQNSVSFNPQAMMGNSDLISQDIENMSDTEFKDMLISIQNSMSESGFNAGNMPDPSLMSDDEIAQMKLHMQEMQKLTESGEFPPMTDTMGASGLLSSQNNGCMTDYTQQLLNSFLKSLSDNENEDLFSII